MEGGDDIECETDARRWGTVELDRGAALWLRNSIARWGLVRAMRRKMTNKDSQVLSMKQDIDEVKISI